MKHTLIAGLMATAATTTALGIAQPAHALSLRPELWDTFNSMVNKERQSLADSTLPLLNANSLYWDGVDPVKVFFINEGAGYRNQLFFSANGGSSEMIFEDVSSPDSILANWDGPLALGEGRNLGSFEGETQLDFSIKANGYNNANGNVYGSNAADNPDGLEHLIAFEYFDEVEKKNYVVLGFEDLYGTKANGSDRDFNDVVFAVSGIQQGAPAADVPEPSILLGLIVGVGGFLKLRCRGTYAS